MTSMTGNSSENGHPPRVFIFDGTRLRSHVFFRYMSTHPDVAPIYHPFLMAAMFGPEKCSQHLKHSEMRQRELDVDLAPLQVPDTYEDNRTAFKQAVANADQQGLIPMANEHWFNVFRTELVLDLLRGNITEPAQLGRNPTNLPDDFFDVLTPVILIRHPALSVRSIYRDSLKFTKQRPGDEDFALIVENKSLRLLFDYFTAQGRQPAVVDGEDIIWRTKEMSEGLMAKLGGSLDPTKLKDVWRPVSKDEIAQMNPLVYALTKDIQHSNGIERPGTKIEPTIDAMYEEWVADYGGDIAQQLRELAQANMANYEYLKQYKV